MNLNVGVVAAAAAAACHSCQCFVRSISHLCCGRVTAAAAAAAFAVKVHFSKSEKTHTPFTYFFLF